MSRRAAPRPSGTGSGIRPTSSSSSPAASGRNSYKYHSFSYHVVTQDIGALLGSFALIARGMGKPIRRGAVVPRPPRQRADWT